MPADDNAGAGQEIFALGGDFDFPQDYLLGGVPVNVEEDQVSVATGVTDLSFDHGLDVVDDGSGHATVSIDESELTIPSSAADVSVDSTTLSGVGTDVQAVLEELDNLLDDHSARHENGGADEISIAGLDGTPVELTNHLADAADAHDASAISILDAANDFTATDVEGALAELQSDAEAAATSFADHSARHENGGADEISIAGLDGTPVELTNHLGDAVDAHDASAISADSTTLVGVGTDVQAVLEELDNGIADHLADAADAHDASAISLVPFGSISSTDVQSAFQEAATEFATPVTVKENGTPVTGTVDVIDFGVGFDVTDSPAGEANITLDLKEMASLDYLTEPVVRSVSAEASGTGAVAGILPAGHVQNDILLLFVQSAGTQPATAPAGYAQIGPRPGVGTGAGSTTLSVFWKRDGGSEAAPTVADTGDHTYVTMAAISGCPTTGDPFYFLGTSRKTATSTVGGPSRTFTHSLDIGLAIVAFAHGVDNASAQASSPSGTAVGGITELFDDGTTDGTGGGLVIYSFDITDARTTYGAVTHTWANTTVDVSTTFVMLPVDARNITDSPRQTEVQQFLTPGTDTWTKPSGAKFVDIIAIGGGGSGGQGRSAATAAGGAGGGGGGWCRKGFRADELQATMNVTCGAGGVGGAVPATAVASNVSDNGLFIVVAGRGTAGADANSANGGQGGSGGSVGSLAVATGGAQAVGGAGGAQGSATDGSAGTKADMGGGGGGSGNQTALAGGAGGTSEYGGGGGGGGTVTGAGGAGGVGGGGVAGGVSKGGSAGAGVTTLGGSGGAGGSDSPTAGGNGAQPGGGGGGGGNATGSGGNGGDGAVTIITYF